MNKITSLFLSIFISVVVIGGFFTFLFYKKPEKKVYIHTAIIALEKSKINSVKKRSIQNKNQKNKKRVKKSPKKGSESITKGGDIDFNDIFKNVNYNVKTEKVKLKSNKDLSRLKGLEKELKNLKSATLNIKVSKKRLSNAKISNKTLLMLQNVWNEVSSMAGEYAKIRLNVIGGRVDVVILKSNISVSKQRQLIRKIKKLNFEHDFSLIITFQTKVNND